MLSRCLDLALAPANPLHPLTPNPPGRQVAGKPVEGFPNGLPDLTPLGVRITLENMIGGAPHLLPSNPVAGPNGEMVMNPIPGEAGTDYPVFTEGSLTS